MGWWLSFEYDSLRHQHFDGLDVGNGMAMGIDIEMEVGGGSDSHFECRVFVVAPNVVIVVDSKQEEGVRVSVGIAILAVIAPPKRDEKGRERTDGIWRSL